MMMRPASLKLRTLVGDAAKACAAAAAANAKMVMIPPKHSKTFVFALIMAALGRVRNGSKADLTANGRRTAPLVMKINKALRTRA